MVGFPSSESPNFQGGPPYFFSGACGRTAVSFRGCVSSDRITPIENLFQPFHGYLFGRGPVPTQPTTRSLRDGQQRSPWVNHLYISPGSPSSKWGISDQSWSFILLVLETNQGPTAINLDLRMETVLGKK